MKPKDYYQSLIEGMPTGAERIVLRVLSYHVGLENAIEKPHLIERCAAAGLPFHERQLRLTIVKLRKAGVPVCSSSGDSGYFLAASLDEYREFRGREYLKKIIDMRETVSAMDSAVRGMFPAEYQEYQREKAARAGQPALL